MFCNLLNAMTLNTLSSKLGETTHIFFKNEIINTIVHLVLRARCRGERGHILNGNDKWEEEEA